jgi:hypothetical protein
MKLSLDVLGKAFRLSLRPQANIISFLYLVIGVVFLVIMNLLGGWLSGLVRSTIPGIIFLIIGLLGFLYMFISAAYLLNYLAFADLQQNKKAGFGEALGAYNKQQGQVLILPAIFGGAVLIEIGIFQLIDLINEGNVTFFLSAIFYIPFLIFNLILFTILFMGGGIFLPIMIDQKKGAFGAIKAIALTIKQQFLRIVIVQVAVSALLAAVGLIVYAIFKFSGMVFMSPLSDFLRIDILLKDPARLFMGYGFNALGTIGMIFYGLGMVFIVSVLLAFVLNLTMCLYTTFYLGFLKEHVNFNEPLFQKKK